MKRRQFTKTEEQNLERFGCTFREKSGVVYVDWRGSDLARAKDAEIFLRLVLLHNDSGLMVFLAGEISPIRPLPRYFYFPFDLAKQEHRKFLNQFANSGKITLRFFSGAKSLDRLHSLTPYLRDRTAETYVQALERWNNWDGDHDLDAVLQRFERHARVPLFLDRVLFDESISEVRVNAKRTASGVPNENRALAASIVREAATAFEPFYQRNGETMFNTINATRAALSSVGDLRRMFAKDPEGLTEFFSDLLSASFPLSELQKINRLLALGLSLFNLPFRQEVENQPTPGIALSLAIPDIPQTLVSLFQSMGTLGISKNSLGTFAELLGLEVGGQPGRPSKGYFREYELKISGLSWTEVARNALVERLDLQKEFGTSDYNSLDHAVKERLRHRIRQGVLLYAKNSGKPAPSELDVAELPPAKREQEIP